jgi:hypothetical protein
VSAPLARCGSGRAPLLGHNLVRLVYLDEGGTDFKAPVLSVAGVLVHGDYEYPNIDERILALIDQFIPEKDRLGFVFHATDIFHGSGYFDRRKPQWDNPAKRFPILDGLATIIDDLHLPIVAGNYQKAKYGTEHPIWDVPPDDKLKGKFLHSSAVMDALMRADKWLEKYSPTELATVVHEDGTPAKKMIKNIVRTMRSRDLMQAKGFSLDDIQFFEKNYNIPLKRIIDTVHFAEKADARPLQLADLCAFILARGLKGLEVPTYASNIVWKYMRWFFKDIIPPEKYDRNLSEYGKSS